MPNNVQLIQTLLVTSTYYFKQLFGMCVGKKTFFWKLDLDLNLGVIVFFFSDLTLLRKSMHAHSSFPEYLYLNNILEKMPDA